MSKGGCGKTHWRLWWHPSPEAAFFSPFGHRRHALKNPHCEPPSQQRFAEKVRNIRMNPNLGLFGPAREASVGTENGFAPRKLGEGGRNVGSKSTSFHRNPAVQARPGGSNQPLEASQAWWRETTTAKRRQPVQAPRD